jgi:hypothetical protein
MSWATGGLGFLLLLVVGLFRQYGGLLEHVSQPVASFVFALACFGMPAFLVVSLSCLLNRGEPFAERGKTASLVGGTMCIVFAVVTLTAL